MVFCTSCGVENIENAKYCENCGKSLEDEKFESWKNTLKNRKEKSPVVTVILNFLIAGLGFVYIKEYAKAVLSFIFVVIVGIMGSLLLGIYYFGFLALFRVMAWNYDETKKYNQKLT